MPKRLTLGLGPPSGVSIGRVSGVGALWDCVSVSAVEGAAVPAAVCRWGLARAVLMWGGVSRGYIQSSAVVVVVVVVVIVVVVFGSRHKRADCATRVVMNQSSTYYYNYNVTLQLYY